MVKWAYVPLMTVLVTALAGSAAMAVGLTLVRRRPPLGDRAVWLARFASSRGYPVHR
jgi:hypothetical protein